MTSRPLYVIALNWGEFVAWLNGDRTHDNRKPVYVWSADLLRGLHPDAAEIATIGSWNKRNDADEIIHILATLFLPAWGRP